MAASSYDDLTKKLNAETLSQVQGVLSDLSNVADLKSYNQEGLGKFPYWLLAGPSGQFNELTYKWINQVVKYDANTDSYQNTDNALTSQLGTDIYTSLSYALDANDKTKLDDTQTKTAAEGNALVSAYTMNVGPIPSGTTNNLNYVTGQILTWATPGSTLTLTDLKQSFDLSGSLGNMPAGGSAVLPALTTWLNAASETLSLQNSVSLGNAMISYLKGAVKQPNPATSLPTLDPTNPNAQTETKPKWSVNTNSNQILNSLKNAGKSVKMSIEASNFNSTTTDLSINGSGAGSFGIDFLTFGAGGSASYNVHTANTSGATATIEIEYPGVTTIPLKPMNAALAGNSAEGWLYQSAITQANNNGSTLPPKESGYVFEPALPSQYDLGTDGNFGFLNTVIVSAQPTIKITYSGGDSSVYKSVFQQQSSWNVSVLGLFSIASGSQSYYKAQVEESSSGAGFSVTIAPDATEFTVPDAQKRANVIAAAASWPGNA